MKHLFVVRHGDYGYDHRINSYGHQQMKRLGEVIKQILNGSSAYFFTSTAPRALDSSQILADQLTLSEFEEVSYLWSGPDSPPSSFYYKGGLVRVMELVAERRDKADGLIMVTHFEVIEEFPSYFLKKEFEQDKQIGKISRGQAVHLDLEQRTYQIFPK